MRQMGFGLVRVGMGSQPVSQAYQRIHALGRPFGAPAAAAQQPRLRPAPEPGLNWKNDPRFTKIPAVYTATVALGKAQGNSAPGSVQLRPEPFVLQRITWATDGDVPPQADTEPGYSLQGRAVTIAWSDEFTKFMGNSPSLIAAVFGDSNGFLDLPAEALFQGSQTLSVTLTRLFWPAGTSQVGTSRFDFVFQGLGLLPAGVNQSGSAG